MGVLDRLKHAWNAFTENKYMPNTLFDMTASSWDRPDRHYSASGIDRSIVNSIYNRIAIDVAAITIQHVRLDKDGRFESVIDSDLNKCFTLSANADQTGRAFFQDVAMSLCDEGVVAIVPTKADLNLRTENIVDVHSLRVGKILQWFPKEVQIEVYNEDVGHKEEIILPKSIVAIVENPLYAVMNEPNSTLKRLIRKLNLLDAIDEQSGSGKLDIIIQLPYVVRSDYKRQQAEQRRKDIEQQLRNSKYGIAYADATEHITQLNRPVENNLMSQVEYLTGMLYSQLGMTQEVFNGTADEKTMLNYNNQTIEPIVSAIVDEMKRKFLTKTARSQGQSISYFRDAFRLVPVDNIADIADKFTRNEILSSNEVRSIIGYKPVDDPKADELRNKNLNQNNNENGPPASTAKAEEGEDTEG